MRFPTLVLAGCAVLLAGLYPSSSRGQDTVPDKVQSYLRALQGPDGPARVAAAINLGELGPRAAVAAPALTGALRSSNEDVRLNAALALGRIGKAAVSSLAKVVQDKDDDVRFYAVWALGLVGPDARDEAAALVRALGDTNDGVRRKAAWSLGRIGQAADEVVPALIKSLSDANDGVRQSVIEAITRFQVGAVPHLIRTMKASDSLRSQAATILGNLPADAESMVPCLIPYLEEKSIPVQEAVIQLLVRQGKDGIPKLIDALGSDNTQVQQGALFVLTTLPGDAVRTVPRATTLLQAKSAAVKQNALVVLGHVGPEGVGSIVKGLQDSDSSVRWTAAHALAEIGPMARAALPALTRALQDDSAEVRTEAQAALNAIQAKKSGK